MEKLYKNQLTQLVDSYPFLAIVDLRESAFPITRRQLFVVSPVLFRDGKTIEIQFQLCPPKTPHTHRPHTYTAQTTLYCTRYTQVRSDTEKKCTIIVTTLETMEFSWPQSFWFIKPIFVLQNIDLYSVF